MQLKWYWKSHLAQNCHVEVSAAGNDGFSHFARWGLVVTLPEIHLSPILHCRTSTEDGVRFFFKTHQLYTFPLAGSLNPFPEPNCGFKLAGSCVLLSPGCTCALAFCGRPKRLAWLFTRVSLRPGEGVELWWCDVHYLLFIFHWEGWLHAKKKKKAAWSCGACVRGDRDP